MLAIAGSLPLVIAVSSAGCEPLVREAFSYEPGGSSADAIGLGEVCIPTDEDFASYSGFSVGEISIADRDPQCASGTCLVHHFQGRVTCPEGNVEGGECFTPLGELVTVPVAPQLSDRPPQDAVFCSCRCDGPARYAPFCACPNDMICEPLLDPGAASEGLGLGEGSYCVNR
jgi:hypothetical protein